MILFYLYLSQISGVFSVLYNCLCDIQACFYNKIKKDKSYYAKLKNKDEILKIINEIIYLIFQKQKNESKCSRDLYEISIKEFNEFIDENEIDKKKFFKL